MKFPKMALSNYIEMEKIKVEHVLISTNAFPSTHALIDNATMIK